MTCAEPWRISYGGLSKQGQPASDCADKLWEGQQYFSYAITDGAAHDKNHECENFCHLNPECGKAWDEKDKNLNILLPQLVGCCGFCDCFHRKSTNDVKLWPVNPTATGA